MKHLWLFLLLSLSACVQQQQVFDQPSADTRDLMTWLEQELSPYLAGQMAQDPRFRDQSIMLVRLNGSEIQAEIDQLTRHIRRQIKDDLLDTPGIRLPWQPMTLAPKHHRRLSSVQCRPSRNADYYIGVEIIPVLSGKYRVSVRALDMSEQQWVNGFGMRWQGQLTRDERQALSRVSVDESLRGLRPLPFTTGQTDMAADYLANNVSCLLLQQDEDQLLVHVQPVDDGVDYMDRLLKLVANNLSRYHEVSITDQAAQADYLLTLEALTVQPGLDQVWTAINRRGSSVRLSGMDTSTYIAQVSVQPSTGEFIELSPEIQNMSVTKALDQTLCPGATGYCDTLTIDALDTNDLFIVQHHASAQLRYLSPGACGGKVQSLGVDSSRHKVSVRTGAGETTFHAIAANQHSGDAIAAHLASLPQSCMNPTSNLDTGEMNQWLAQLEQIMQQQQPHISWVATRTTH
jgi:hypothetical protein